MDLDSKNEYIVVGDIHGCIDEFKLLLKRENFKIDSRGYITSAPKSVILIGDFIDKAEEPKLRETIEFIYKNYLHFYLILGNHEKRVYEYITEEGRPEAEEEEKKYYNTSLLLKRDLKLKEKFLFLYNKCHIWLRYRYGDLEVVITHAPCRERHLAQDDELSKAKMVKCESRSQNRGVKLDTLLHYLIDEAEDNRKIHIFGHLSQPNIRRYKNKICIDTSCIYGNSLSYAILKGDTISFNSLPFLNLQKPAKQHYNLLFDF